MNLNDKLFLEALNASLENKKVDWEMIIKPSDWLALFHKAEIHQVLPLVFDAVYQCPAAKAGDAEFFQTYRKKVVRQVMVQTMRTAEFLKLYKHLQEKGLHPLVVKGLVCRQLYPNPDYRSSSDEDVLIRNREFVKCNNMLRGCGMEPTDDKQDLDATYEVAYRKAGTPLYIELHKALFSPDSVEYGEFNEFFKGAHSRRVKIQVQGVDVYTLNYTDHLFYLICHAFKHLLHGGFGIRQVCDMVMFANTYGNEIDWEQVRENCKKIGADKFAIALFKIGEKYLNFDLAKACYPEDWANVFVDEHALLEDMLSGGIYGGATMSRKHSSRMTLNAVKAEKKGKTVKYNILKTIFPARADLKGKYTYLERFPFLLPVAWMSRIVKYQKETRQDKLKGNSPAESIKIGNQRIELLRQYGILNQEE